MLRFLSFRMIELLKRMLQTSTNRINRIELVSKTKINSSEHLLSWRHCWVTSQVITACHTQAWIIFNSASVFFTGFWFCDIRPVQISSNLKIIGNVWTNLMSHPNTLYLEHKHFSELQASCVSSSCRPNTTDCVTGGPWWIKIPKCKIQWQPQTSNFNIFFCYQWIQKHSQDQNISLVSPLCLPAHYYAAEPGP